MKYLSYGWQHWQTKMTAPLPVKTMTIKEKCGLVAVLVVVIFISMVDSF